MKLTAKSVGRLTAAALVVAAIVIATQRTPAATATPTWKPAEVFVYSAVNNIPIYPGLSMDPLGNAYLRGGVGRYARRPPGGPFEAVQMAPGVQTQDQGLGYQFFTPSLAFDAAGNALMVFRPASSLEVVYRPAGSVPTLPASQVLGTTFADGYGSRHEAVAMNDSGQGLVAWVAASTSPAGQFVKVASRASGASSQFDLAGAQSFPVALSIGTVDVAVDANGTELVVWYEDAFDSSTLTHLQTIWQATRAGGAGPFSARTAVATVNYSPACCPQFACNRSGDAALTWADEVTSTGRFTIYAAYRPHGGAFQAPQEVGPDTSAKWTNDRLPAAAVLANGTAIVVCNPWQGDLVACPVGSSVTEASAVAAWGVFQSSTATGAWTPPAPVDVRASVVGADVAVEALGGVYLAASGDRVAIVYTHQSSTIVGGYCGTAGPTQAPEVLARFGTGTTFGPAMVVPGAAPATAGVAIDASGNALVATVGSPSILRIVAYESGGSSASITSASPSALSVGTSVAVAGSGFTTKPKAWLDLAGKKIVLKVAKGATDTAFTAVLASTHKNTSGACTLNVLPRGVKTALTFPGMSIEKPAITTVSPTTGAAKASVTITGAHFGTAKGRVLFGTAAGKVKTWTDTSITVLTPKQKKTVAAGTKLDVTVSNNAGAVVDAAAFTTQ